MNNILDVREKIYNYIHNNEACQNYFFNDDQEEDYAAYYTTMYLLQDTSESLLVHREQGFSDDSCKAYIEFWGVMQAIIIQQDSIHELYETITATKLDSKSLTSWQELRLLRNTCAGHPAKRDRHKSIPLTRSFMGRNFGDYSSITYEQREKPKNKGPSNSPLENISHPEVKLGKLIDEYEKEATKVLQGIFEFMKNKWDG